MNALEKAGIVPNRDYYGVVDFYDPEFSVDGGRGRIKGYMGKDILLLEQLKLFEVFETGLKSSLSTKAGKNILIENEIVRFRVTIGTCGFTAVDVVAIMKVSPTVVDVISLLERMTRNSSSYSPPAYPVGPSIRGLGARVGASYDRDLEEDLKEIELPKIIKLSKEEVANEQKA